MSKLIELSWEDKIRDYTRLNVPYSNVVGLARSILAMGTLFTLLLNPIDNILIKNTNGEFVLQEILNKDIFTNFNFFFLFGTENLSIVKWLSIVILISVISGYFQKITSVLHWWVCISFVHASTIIDGGDQIASNLSLFLIPICLFDNRKNHWDRKVENESIFNLLSLFFLYLIQLQMAIIYFHAAVGKFGHTEWSNGTALYYWLNHSSFGLPDYLKFINELLSNSYFITLITYGSLILELALFLALLAGKKYKMTLLFMAIIFHFFIIICLGIFSFFFSVVAGLILYLYPTNTNIKILCLKK
jgi:antimicrobial peptide system SdpB family protein